MKNLLLFVVSSLILMAFASCSSFSNRGEVERPMIGAANTQSMSFERIVLTDSATIIDAVVNFRPGYWIRLASTCQIAVDGVSYPMSAISGIEAGEQVTMPDSAVIRFTMTFPAIPANAKSLDFSEGTADGWALWNVDLTGKASHDMNRSQVPSAALKNNRSLPENMLAYGDSTVINFHILGYKPEMGNRLSWAANTLHGQVGLDQPDVEVDENGNAVLKLSLSAPAEILPILLNGGVNIGGMFIAAPGETLNVYLDTHKSGIWNMQTRDGEAFISPDKEYRNIYTDGLYPLLTRRAGMDLYTGEFGDYHMDGDAYTAYILNKYRALTDSLNAVADLTDSDRRYNKALLDGELIFAAAGARNWLERNYYNTHGWNSPVPADSINCELSPENIKAIAAVIDFNNPDLILSDELGGSMVVNFTDLWESAGVDAGMLNTLKDYNVAYAAAESGQLDAQALASLNLPAPLAAELSAHNAAMKARIAELTEAALVTPTPEVSADNVFDAIVAPHKGKVVMVDLWNTWCGPCRAALKENEPEKSGDLSSDDIVWIYIANQTSPKAKYLQMIPEIKGIHYQVDQDQWRAICERFNVDGIPFYILVDRNGHAAARPDLRDHSLYKSALLSALAR